MTGGAPGYKSVVAAETHRRRAFLASWSYLKKAHIGDLMPGSAAVGTVGADGTVGHTRARGPCRGLDAGQGPVPWPWRAAGPLAYVDQPSTGWLDAARRFVADEGRRCRTGTNGTSVLKPTVVGQSSRRWR
ncbi:hypothetical protein GCM10012279_10560 [Micromonospora yangpuensis]|nr:hypothetical protein GCM10012279_10560 [Micromonospora yangpuensis]